jgi:hypothetical protein
MRVFAAVPVRAAAGLSAGTPFGNCALSDGGRGRLCPASRCCVGLLGYPAAFGKL